MLHKIKFIFIVFLFCFTLFTGCGSSSDSNSDSSSLIGGATLGKTLPQSGVATTFVTGFDAPFDITNDGTYFYVTDYYNNLVKKIDTTGDYTEITEIAGTYTTGSINAPSGITTDGSNLYVINTSDRSIIKINIATGKLITLVGSEISNQTAFYGITTDGDNLYVAVTNRHVIKKISLADSSVTILAGTDNISGSTDGDGTEASFSSPHGITTDGVSLFVADTENHTIREIDIETGEVTTLAGLKETAGNEDGASDIATFNNPYGITTDGTALFITDTGNYSIRRVDLTTGEVSTPAYTDSETESNAAFTSSFGNGLTTDGLALYVADTDNDCVKKIE